MSLHSFQTRAICLGSADYGETHRLVDLFSEVSGRIRVIAHGIRKPLSRLSGSLETGSLVHAQLAGGRLPGMLASVRECRVLEAFPALRANLEAMTRVFAFLAFLARRLPEGSPDADAFREAVALLAAFAMAEIDSGAFQVLESLFEARMLGKLPDWRHCAGCGCRSAALVVNRHGPACPACRPLFPGQGVPLDPGMQELLAQASGTGVAALRGVVLEPRRLADAQRILRLLLDEPLHPGVP